MSFVMIDNLGMVTEIAPTTTEKGSEYEMSRKVPGLAATIVVKTGKKVSFSFQDGSSRIDGSVYQREVYGVVTQDGREVWKSNAYYYHETSTATLPAPYIGHLPADIESVWLSEKQDAFRLSFDEAKSAMRVKEREISASKKVAHVEVTVRSR